MSINKETIGGMVGTTISAIGTGIQTSEVLRIISLVLTIIGSIITIAMGLSNWWKQAKKDDKITKDEIEEGAKIIANGVSEVQEIIKSKDKEGK